MPFTKDGMKPDIIFNPLSIPSRMTTGVIFEGMLAKLCAHRGVTSDATMFKKIDTDNIADLLEKNGFNRNGTERLYNGMTGNYLDVEIFIAPLYYQVLQRYTCDVVYSHSTSPTDCLTRQPLHGKKVQGGTRLGAMECSVLSTNSVNFLNEKITEHSDGFDIYVCANCSQRGVVNQEHGIYKCSYCSSNSNLQKVPSTYTSRLFLDELASMSIGTKLHLKRPQYEEFL